MSAATIARRTLPGSVSFPAWSSTLNDVDRSWDSFQGPYAIQEYIQTKIRTSPSDISSLINIPSDDINEPLWLYEHLRCLLAELNDLLISLNDECTLDKCPIMKATNDWEFLCAAHTTPKKCCAIDYMLHTLTGFTTLLNDAELFPNRTNITTRSAQQFPSIARRLYRLFAHAYYHHQEIFNQWEQQRYTYQRFIALVQKYQLMEKQHLTPNIPTQQT